LEDNKMINKVNMKKIFSFNLSASLFCLHWAGEWNYILMPVLQSMLKKIVYLE